MRISSILIALLLAFPVLGQEKANLSYQVEMAALAGNGDHAPLWFTANRYGTVGTANKQASLHAGLAYHQDFKHHWKMDAGLELMGGVKLVSDFWIHQAYADFSWKQLSLSIGSKERIGSPLERNKALTSGWLIEGPNIRPIPQIRAEINEYLSVPGTRDWLAFKGHLAYGWFTDGNWQEDFAQTNQTYVKQVLYHSKSLMLRVGNKEKFPVEFEFGLLMATQFGGKQYLKLEDGSSQLRISMPRNLKAYWKAFLPQEGGDDTPEGEQVNTEGNVMGSWNFALNWYAKEWKIRTYLEHLFDDHSQMFWEYGRWKDGLIGVEITPPANKWISSIVWEGMNTKDQTKSILYDGFWGSFSDIQMSGNDDYYNQYLYGAWQHHGLGMGNPLLPGPLYNNDGSIRFRSNRVRSNHLGISGSPTEEWSWRMLASFARHWGTYAEPLDKQRKQFSGLVEVSYQPKQWKGWSTSISCGFDKGNYLDNAVGGMLTIRKTGGFNL